MKKETISVFGLGKLGCTMLACFAHKGWDVIGVDISEVSVEKVNAGLSPIYEPGVAGLIEKNKKRIVAVFQPHRYSRIKFLLENFSQAFHEADKVILAPIFSAGEKNTFGITDETLLNNIEHEKSIMLVKEKDELLTSVMNEIEAGDMVIFMGAGDIYKQAYDLSEKLSNIN